MEEKDFFVLDPGIADEIITAYVCCFVNLLPFKNK